VAKAEPAPDKKPEPRAEIKPEPKATETAKARALLAGKSIDAAAEGVRYVVQVGAFAEKDKARMAQQKLERAGLKNYTNVAETKNGTRIRVRAGPFASKAEADRAAEKIKGRDLPAAILTL
jgi:DedD protein